MVYVLFFFFPYLARALTTLALQEFAQTHAGRVSSIRHGLSKLNDRVQCRAPNQLQQIRSQTKTQRCRHLHLSTVRKHTWMDNSTTGDNFSTTSSWWESSGRNESTFVIRQGNDTSTTMSIGGIRWYRAWTPISSSRNSNEGGGPLQVPRTFVHFYPFVGLIP